MTSRPGPPILDSPQHRGDGPAPPGQPQLYFTNPSASGPHASTHEQPLYNLPVPPRPGFSVSGDGLQQPRIVPGGSGVKTVATARPPGNEVPTAALVFPGGKTVDYYPYTGNHPEDVLSESLVKSGISNKSQIMNETNTARPSLWPNLKGNSGLNTLATLCVTILEKRELHNRLSAPSTYKPPPRITLRDSTRETWLYDLANPHCSLRRLCKTIPHGLTGRSLLEQCLNKNIPYPRAMWLVKTVGVNEMRTHKRKGQAGAASWVRGWTCAVEQVLENEIADTAQRDWQRRRTYVIHLTTHLFQEELLEHDHFLDWTLKNLESSSPQRVFMWLHIICIPDIWGALVSIRRRGKRLAESVLEHAEKFYGAEATDQFAPLLSLLDDVLLKLIRGAPASLVLPATWAKHSPMLHLLAERKPKPNAAEGMKMLDCRNGAVLMPQKRIVPLVNDAVGRVYQLLDSVDCTATICIHKLSSSCMDTIGDTTQLVLTVLSWASSLYRQGSSRIYLVSRLLRTWKDLGADIFNGIVTCLPRLAVDQSKEVGAIFRIIAELVRSQSFSPSRFLQWLIATGSLSQHQDMHSPSAWPLRLVTEMPLTGLSENAQILRHALLRGTIYSVEMEQQAIKAAKAALCHQLPSLAMRHPEQAQSGSATKEYSPIVRLEMGAWLSQVVLATMKFVTNVPTSVRVSSTVCMMPLGDFQVVRSYLEDSEDYGTLAQVVLRAATSLDSNVLRAAADTASHNLEAFRAIGVFESIFEGIAMRYTSIRTLVLPERDLLLSVMDLARTAHPDLHLMQLLTYDLSRYDPRHPLAACSPASDSMVDGTANLNVEEEIERSLASGTSMDQQMMSRVFQKIAAYLEDQLCNQRKPGEIFSTWFYRLRSFEENTFEELMDSWLKALLLDHREQILSTALPLLIASGSLTFDHLLNALQECIKGRQSTRPEESLRIAIDGLDTLLPRRRCKSLCREQDIYRYRLEQHRFCRQRCASILGLVETIAELVSTGNFDAKDFPLAEVCLSDRLLIILRHSAIIDAQSLSALATLRQQTLTDPPCFNVGILFGRLLDPLGRLELSKMSPEEQVATIVPRADYLSLPFCQLALQQIFSAGASTEAIVNSISTVVLSTLRSEIEREQSWWTELLSGLDLNLVNKVREHAERAFIDTTEFLCGPITDRMKEQLKVERSSSERYMRVIEATTVRASSEVQASFIVSLTERLKGFLDICSRTMEMVRLGRLAIVESRKDLPYWFNILLRLATIYGPTMMMNASPEHQATLMWMLTSLLYHPYIAELPSSSLFAFDVAILLSDSMSDDARKHLDKLTGGKAPADMRWKFLFGKEVSKDRWLNLKKPGIHRSKVRRAHSSSHGQAHPSSHGQAHPSSHGQAHSSSHGQAHSSSHGQAQSSSHGQAQSSSHGQAQSSSHGQAHSSSHGQAYSSSHGQAPSSSMHFANGSSSMQRSSGQQNIPQQIHAHNQGRVYSQYSGHSPAHTMPPPQVQRVASNGMAQQRSLPAFPGPQQRPTVSQHTTGATGNPTKQDEVEMKAVPFSLNSWEILPEGGGNPMRNETALSLSLFGARRV